MSPDQGPLVSIVTPSFNQSAFIEETIKSVQNQRYDNLEHIVVDGESTDGTLELLRQYEATYNLRWISEPDEGQTDAINKGFSMAEGEIVGWLNSDDVYIDRSVVDAVVQAFQDDADLDWLYGDSAIIDKEGVILRVEVKPGFQHARLLRSCYIDQPSVFFRRQVVDEHKLNADLNYAMDYEYWLRLSQRHRVRHVNRVLSGDRNHPDRKIISDRAKMQRESEQVQRRYGQPFNIVYKLGRLQDKVVSGLCRLRGLLRWRGLVRRNDFACTVRPGNTWATVYRQLLLKNRDLAG